MSLTLDQLLKVMPRAGKRATQFLEPLNRAMEEGEITTPARAAAFLAQIAHESGELRYVRELGSEAYLDKYDTGKLAERLGNTPEDDDDGQRYRGRGLIQITGRANYEQVSKTLNVDFIAAPELLEEPEWACRSAAWFWKSRGLNTLADQGNFRLITRRINGGLNGLEDRLRYWAAARDALVSSI